MVSGSLVSVAGPLGCSLLQLVGCLVVGLLQAEAVLPNPVDCPYCSASWTSQQVVHRQSGLLSEEQEVGCEAGRGVRRVVVRLDQLRQMDGPPGLLLRRQRTQQTVHGAVETLALGVSLRSGPWSLNLLWSRVAPLILLSQRQSCNGAEWSKDKTQAAESIKWRPQQAYGSNQFLLVQPQTVFSTPKIITLTHR